MITFNLGNSRYKLLAITFLFLLSASLYAENPLSCSPSEEKFKPLAICAVAVGGCEVAKQFVESSEEERFLAGEACTALASQITGEDYNVSDFLGNGVLELLNRASNEGIESNDTTSQVLGWVGKLSIGVFKTHSFIKCLEAARTKCKLLYAENRGYIEEREEPSVSSKIETKDDSSAVAGNIISSTNYVSRNEKEIHALVKKYYLALSEGDNETVRRIRIQQSNIHASHSFAIQDIQLVSCSTLEECETHVDVIAFPKSDSKSKHEERWVVSVKTIQQDGEWKIASINGGDVYKAVVKTMQEYYEALTNGDHDIASSKWVEPPERLATLIGKNHTFKPKFHIANYGTESVKVNVNLTIYPKGKNKDYKNWDGYAVLVNNDDSWKIALTRFHLEN